MNEKELDAIEARLNATTAGEWWYHERKECIGSPAGWVASLAHRERKSDIEFCDKQDDADFITHAHNHDIPTMLAEVRRLRKELRHIKYPGPPHDVEEFYKDD